MKVRSRKPAAGTASASTNRYETPSARYISAEIPRYGTTEVAMSSRLRRRRGLAYGSRTSRQAGRSARGRRVGTAAVAVAPWCVCIAPFPFDECFEGRPDVEAPQASRRVRALTGLAPQRRPLPQLLASSAPGALSAAIGPWPAFWPQGQLVTDDTPRGRGRHPGARGRDRRAARGRPRSHVEREHPVGVDPRIERAGVEELLPLRAVARDVDVEQCLSELRALLAADVDRDGAAVDGDRQLLAGKMGRADLRPRADVAEAHGIGGRA